MYAEYIVLDRSSTQEDRAESNLSYVGTMAIQIDKLLSIWQPIENYNALRWSYHIIYQNEQYNILKRVALTSLQ